MFYHKISQFSYSIKFHSKLCKQLWIRSITSQPCIGIKRETINIWEQRAPLSPRQIKQLIDKGVRVLIQPSNRRCFPCSEYTKVGAEIQENLEPASVILGVKRPTQLDEADLMPNKTYVFFTHTIKAQPGNMDLLDTLLERKIRIIDYECMVNSKGKRLVAFGSHAGMVGTINILNGLGMRLLSMGYSTPFLKIGLARNYFNSEDAKNAVRMAGYHISLGHLQDAIGPLIFVVTGTGNVSEGVQSILNCLPIEFVPVNQLKNVFEQGDKRKIYTSIIRSSDYAVRNDGGKFELNDFYQNPEQYHSVFAEQIAPYTSVMFNGINWKPGNPRLITKQDTQRICGVRPTIAPVPGIPQIPHRLLAISDISADINGSIEFTEETTTIDSPFCIYNPYEQTNTNGFLGEGILMCSIDNMPAELPYEATEHFGQQLSPYLDELVSSDATQPFEDFKVSNVIKNAVITSNGQLTPKFQYISNLRAKRERTSGPCLVRNSLGKRVLVLGAGYVVPSLLDYLQKDDSVNITVASHVQSELNEVCKGRNNIEPICLDIFQDKNALSKLIDSQDLVISLIPWKYHPHIAEQCIARRRNMLTASYCTPVLKEMEERFKDAGISAFMEIGLDPGIDHLLSQECFDQAIRAGGQIKSYRSYTGGLPAPEFSDNPLRYKFSWSPEAALSTTMNEAIYLENGKINQIPKGGLLMKAASVMDIFPGFHLEGYPNRDSTKYIDLYKLDSCHTVIRGTLRYVGFARNVQILLDLGLLRTESDEPFSSIGTEMSWKQFICRKLNLREQLKDRELEKAISMKYNGNENAYRCLDELGLLSDDKIQPLGTPLASTSKQLAKSLTYGPNERDIIIMAHEIGIEWPNHRRETRKVSLVVYGEANRGKAGLAMSRTVGIPTAIAATMMLKGEVNTKGIVLPLTPNIYKPILNKLKDEGIQASEVSSFSDAGTVK